MKFMKKHGHLVVNLIFLVILCAVMAHSQEYLTPTPTGIAIGTATTSTPGVSLDMSTATDSMMIPAGSTSQRPSSPLIGMIRYNTDISSLETYTGSIWGPMAPPLPLSFNNAPSHTIQTVAAAGNGFQLSTTRNALVSYSSLSTTSASISGPSIGYIVLEICPTNSSTAANWLEVGRSYNGQTLTLAIVLGSVQPIGSPVSAIVPAGYYARLRSVAVSGSPTFSFTSGQEVLM